MDILLYYSLKYDGDYLKILHALDTREYFSKEEYLNMTNNFKGDYLSVVDPLYPDAFKKCPLPPFIIYYKGDLSLLNHNKKCGIIGSRFNSAYGKTNVFTIVPQLVVKNVVIVSGLAKGIDSFAHKAALQNDGKTIAVLGTGIEQYYPKENELLQNDIGSLGLLISEFPPNVRPSQENFPLRNRLIAALSDVIFVVESSLKSGTMITVKQALGLGKDICCLPSQNLNESGNNQLIKDGAALVENSDDILQLFAKK
jgi:DNA processing protein